MMTQADLLSQNDEFNKGFTNDANKNILSSFTTFTTTPTTTNSNESSTAAVNFERPRNLEFSDLNAPSYLNEQSPIKPSKYLATDSAINTSVGLRNIIIGGMVFSAVVTIALVIQIIIGTTQVPNRIGIVTQDKVCTEIGAQMVKIGGKSFDAFIASSLCLGVVNPFFAGFGAGGFLMVRDHKHDKNFAVNCFFKSSGNLNISDYLNSPTGDKSVGIPGEFKCLETAYKYARFYWKTLAAPAIRLAENGFNVSKSLAEHLKTIKNEINNDPAMKRMFLDKNGSLVKENDWITNPRLASTLRTLVANERDLYEGELGNSIVDKVNNKITEHDLKTYSEVRDENFHGYEYNDFVMLTNPFPSNGPILKFIIDIMKSASLQVADFKTSKFYEQLLEATQLGYYMSSFIADPQYDPKLNDLLNEKLTLSKNYFNSIFTPNKIDFPFKKGPEFTLKDDLHINFISVNDHNDLMISYVGTLGSSWGSKLMTESGFFLNNGLNLFSYGQNNIKSGNTIDRNKQPRALMTPILTYNKKNPCISRFLISYSHHDHMENMDFALSELSGVILKLFNQPVLYESIVDEKRVQYTSSDEEVCFEDGFDKSLSTQISNEAMFKATNSCEFHSIDLIMKKDHVIYGKVDSSRSDDTAALFNK